MESLAQTIIDTVLPVVLGFSLVALVGTALGIVIPYVIKWGKSRWQTLIGN